MWLRFVHDDHSDVCIGVTRDYSLARKWFSKAAIKGNKQAQYDLGDVVLMQLWVSAVVVM